MKELHRKIGTSPKDEYEQLERILTEARVKFEQTRLSLEQHSAVHRCYKAEGRANRRSLCLADLALLGIMRKSGTLDALFPTVRAGVLSVAL